MSTEGFCSCTPVADGLTKFAGDCGIEAHRERARVNRDPADALSRARAASEAVTIATLRDEIRHLTATLEARRDRELDPDVGEYMQAVSGEGPRAYDWTDKPHRLIYDLVAKVQSAHEEVAQLRTELADIEHQRDQALYQRDTARIGGYRDVGI